MTVLIAGDDILPLPRPLSYKAKGLLVYGFDNDIVVVDGIKIEKGDLNVEVRSQFCLQSIIITRFGCQKKYEKNYID